MSTWRILRRPVIECPSACRERASWKGSPEEPYLGQGAPASTHTLNFAANSAWGGETGSRPTPGDQPQRTSLSWLTCSSSAARSLPPLAFSSLRVRQSSPLETPMKTNLVGGGGRCQYGAPGGMWGPQDAGGFAVK